MTIKKTKKWAILCSGGNAPGMSNCVITFAKKCSLLKIIPYGFLNGFTGLHNMRYKQLSPANLQLYVNDGSALIGTSRCSEFISDKKYREKCAKNLKKLGIDVLFVLGGDGSYRGALKLANLGIKIIAIPLTIDNDVQSTSYTIGYDTCLNNVCRVIDNISDVFISHRGIALVQIMGRTCPDLTVRGGIANYATYIVSKYSILTPDGFVKIAKKAIAKNKINITFLITEHLYDNKKLSLKDIAKYIEKKTGWMTRYIEIGYVQRGGSPSARDRLLANYMVNIGIESILAGRYNRAICEKDGVTIDIDLKKALMMKRKNWNKILVKKFNDINQE